MKQPNRCDSFIGRAVQMCMTLFGIIWSFTEMVEPLAVCVLPNLVEYQKSDPILYRVGTFLVRLQLNKSLIWLFNIK